MGFTALNRFGRASTRRAFVPDRNFLGWPASQPKLREWARRHRLFLTPEENPELCPAELRFVDQAAAVFTASLSLPFGGIARAVIDRLTHSVHFALLRQRKAGALQTEGYLEGLREKLIEAGGFGAFAALCPALGC
jgi:hypothetical protein